MPQVINTNTPSLNAQRNLNSSQSSLATSLQRLSSGLRERAWWHFRAHSVATIRELLTTHANGTEKAAQDNLYKWVIALETVGILQRLPAKQPAKQSKGRVVWSLAKDLGPAAPVWRQIAKTVFDPNSGQVFPLVKVASHD